jgi:hypothetical protein
MTAAYNLARIFGGTMLLTSGLIVMALIMEIAPGEKVCQHEWQYSGTDPRGSHKGEDAYRCTKCHETEYLT